MRQKDCVTMINVEDLFFLLSLVDYYRYNCNANCSIYSEIYKNTVTLHVHDCYRDEDIINSSFSLDICKKYYNNVSKFIEEVL